VGAVAVSEAVVTPALASRMRYTQLAGTVARLRSLQASTPTSAVARLARLAASIDVLERERQAREALPARLPNTNPHPRHASAAPARQGEVTGHTTSRQAPGGTQGAHSMATTPTTPSKARGTDPITGELGTWERVGATRLHDGARFSRADTSPAGRKAVEATSETVTTLGRERGRLQVTTDKNEYPSLAPHTQVWMLVLPPAGEAVGTVKPGVELAAAIEASEVEAAQAVRNAMTEARPVEGEGAQVVELAAARTSRAAGKPAASKPAAAGEKLPKNIDRSIAIVVAYLQAEGKPGERKLAARKDKAVAKHTPTPRMVDHALWEAGLMPNQAVQPSKLIRDHVQAAVASKLGKTWKAASKGAELGRKAGA
jgi:hypothetical protein